MLEEKDTKNLLLSDLLLPLDLGMCRGILSWTLFCDLFSNDLDPSRSELCLEKDPLLNLDADENPLWGF